MVLSVRTKSLIKNLAIPLLIGALAGFLTNADVKEYMATVKQPFFSPPGWVFPVVWTILYALMGFAAYIIENTGSPRKSRALTVYYIQLFFNFVWSFIFFSANNYLFAFVWIIVLWLLIIATILEFKMIKARAAYILIPYLIWVTFAAVLNFSVYLLNK
ncbi:MAG: tryptophan-rich sensory protein [Ruminococcaceae bacterium]|nr:tryptophan-rich sensory protein [Oscillospiraceae bacterium]